MKFLREDLETELQKKEKQINDITNEIIEMFSEANFDFELTINGFHLIL